MKNRLILQPAICLLAIYCGIFLIISPAQAFTPGKTYDASNYQEIEDMLALPVLNYVKNGDFTLITKPLEFEWKYSEDYLRRTQTNQGKFDVDTEGFFVDKQTLIFFREILPAECRVHSEVLPQCI